MLDKYRKNRNMISEEIQEEKHKLDLIEDSGKPVVKTPAVDPLLAIELRHAKLEAKRKERIEKAATKPPENLKENRRSSEANRIRAECKPTKPAEVRTSISAGRKDQEFNEQIRELHDKRRVLEEDSKKIAEEVKMITESVKQQAEVKRNRSNPDRSTNNSTGQRDCKNANWRRNEGFKRKNSDSDASGRRRSRNTTSSA